MLAVRLLLQRPCCRSHWKAPRVIGRLIAYNKGTITTILPMDKLHELFLKEWNTIISSAINNSLEEPTKTKNNTSTIYIGAGNPLKSPMKLSFGMERYTGESVANVPHGKGNCVFKDKRIYEGEFANGKCSGKGKCTYPNSNVIEGEFSDNHPEGMGTERLADGAYYEGNFVKGRWSGMGKLILSDGTRWEGNWVQGVLHSTDCTVTLPNKIVYKGNFKYLYDHNDTKHRTPGAAPPLQSQPSGKGLVLYPDNSRYEGEFKLGKRHGRGTSYDKEGNVVYEGKWVEDRHVAVRESKRTRILKSERERVNVKSGVTISNTPYLLPPTITADVKTSLDELYSLSSVSVSVGSSNMQSKSAFVQYTGDLIEGKRQGRGKLVYSNGSVYEGEFSQHQCHGVGRLTAADGTVYDGLWWYGQMYGEGRITFPDQQRVLRGKFVDADINHLGIM